MKNIVLVGLMGAGKTSVGKKLADILKCEFLDVDNIIEIEQNRTISNIFSTDGEAFFRKLENNTISALAKLENKVISTGGGSVENIDNLNILKTSGFVVYLKATAECLHERIKTETHRPLLQNANPLNTLQTLLKKREKNYLLADYVIDTMGKDITAITDEIIKAYNENN